MLAERQGHYADALGHAEQALRLYQAIGDKKPEAEALNNVGGATACSAITSRPARSAARPSP